MRTYEADVVIAGGGLAGITAAYELLDHGKKVLIIEKGTAEKFGGMAKDSFGGVHIIGTPHQKRAKIQDNPELAYRDWESYAQFEENDDIPRQWAQFYCENSLEYIFEFLDSKKVKFLPVVNWPERGVHKAGNSVPRWHIAWGTGYEIIERCVIALNAHPHRNNLEIIFDHEASDIIVTDGVVVGIRGKSMKTGEEFEAKSQCTVIASGGMCGGDLTKVRENWYKPWGEAPKKLLNGAHIYGDGMLQDRAAEKGANVTHLDLQWHYAAGVHHPAKKRENDGISLVPPRSALWLNAKGERIGPDPLVAYTDTRHLVEQIVQQPGQYSWQLLNWKIAIKELAVSGCDYMTAFRHKNLLMMAWHIAFGNKALVRRLIDECPEDFAVANSLPELKEKMDERSLYDLRINFATMRDHVKAYDDMIDRGISYFNDPQLRRLMNFRTYKGDRIRIAKFQKILDPSAMPLIAIREFILSRKSLGGIQTDLQCRVLNKSGDAIEGLYAVGEAAGFGGGGIHGKGSLEGTFLGGCVLTGRAAGRAIART